MSSIVGRRDLLGRRNLLGGFATFPLIALVSSPPLIAACGTKEPDTPLAHLYGKEWVHGAYKLYAEKYGAVQTSADETTNEAFRVIAQKGIVSLDAIQTRDVPFYIRVDEAAQAFFVERKVPERLTFTADMNDADRKAAERAWKRARDHIHTDYEDIRKLDWALTRLLAQLQRIRNAIEEGRVEQYRLVEQLSELKKDPTKLPYQLPYQVTPKDYEEILLLLLDRLEQDKARLAHIESDVIAVGMTVRSTDANSATLAASIKKVLLAVVEDAVDPAPGALFPADDNERQAMIARARSLAQKIEASAEFTAWRDAEREKKLAALGAFLQTLDAMTGLPTSRIYRTVLDIWRGNHDYLSYLQTIISLVPHGGRVAAVLNEAIEYTKKAREVAGVVVATVKSAQNMTPEQLVAQGTQIAVEKGKGVVINTASRFAMERADKQLSFFKDKLELQKVDDALKQTEMITRAMPKLPMPASAQ